MRRKSYLTVYQVSTGIIDSLKEKTSFNKLLVKSKLFEIVSASDLVDFVVKSKKMVYSLQERVEIFTIFFKTDDCAIRTAAFFNERHADNHLHHPYVRDLVRKFHQTGSVANRKR